MVECNIEYLHFDTGTNAPWYPMLVSYDSGPSKFIISRGLFGQASFSLKGKLTLAYGWNYFYFLFFFVKSPYGEERSTDPSYLCYSNANLMHGEGHSRGMNSPMFYICTEGKYMVYRLD